MANLSKQQVYRYWVLAGIAVFLLIPVDMATTAAAAQKYGVQPESNPIIKWTLKQGYIAFTSLNIVSGTTAFLLTGLLIKVIEKEGEDDKLLKWFVEGWTHLLIAAGVFVAMNNGFFVLYGQPLVAI